MNIRFQADNDPHEDIMRSTKRLRSDIDFQRAPELGLHLGIGDPEVLRLCAEQGRMLVTHDRHTMPATSSSLPNIKTRPASSSFQEDFP